MTAPDTPTAEALVSTIGPIPVIAFTRKPTVKSGDELALSIMQAFKVVAPSTVHPDSPTLYPEKAAS